MRSEEHMVMHQTIISYHGINMFRGTGKWLSFVAINMSPWVTKLPRSDSRCATCFGRGNPSEVWMIDMYGGGENISLDVFWAAQPRHTTPWAASSRLWEHGGSSRPWEAKSIALGCLGQSTSIVNTGLLGSKPWHVKLLVLRVAVPGVLVCQRLSKDVPRIHYLASSCKWMAWLQIGGCPLPSLFQGV